MSADRMLLANVAIDRVTQQAQQFDAELLEGARRRRRDRHDRQRHPEREILGEQFTTPLDQPPDRVGLATLVRARSCGRCARPSLVAQQTISEPPRPGCCDDSRVSWAQPAIGHRERHRLHPRVRKDSRFWFHATSVKG